MTVLFLPGDLPTNDNLKPGFEILTLGPKMAGLDLGIQAHWRAASLRLPSYLSFFEGLAVSSGCSCLNLPKPTTTIKYTSTIVVTTIVLLHHLISCFLGLT